MAETVQIAEMANFVSQDVFNFFKWVRVNRADLNFSCELVDEHAPKTRKNYTHPVDVVFFYDDPYLRRKVFLNTDLKSYAAKSINSGFVRSSINSLANTIDCANISAEWDEKYNTHNEQEIEVRGLLFIYNHDNEYDSDFYDFFRKERNGNHNRSYINPLSLKVRQGQYVHIIEPMTLRFLMNLVKDAKSMQADRIFPQSSYVFFHPDLERVKAKGDVFKHPATIEMLCGPFVMIKHDDIYSYNDAGEREKTFSRGCVIYMRSLGRDHNDFIVLFDKLSIYQMLNKDTKIRIRMPSNSWENARPNFERAIEIYSREWGYDEYKKGLLEAIELGFVDDYRPTLLQAELARD